MIEREIAVPDRSSFFARLSKLHAGSFVTLRVDARDEVIDQPLRGFSTDGADIVINTGDRPPRPHHGHRVLDVRRVRLEQTEEGADAAVTMTSDDGTRTEVRFRWPTRADLLDSAVE